MVWICSYHLYGKYPETVCLLKKLGSIVQKALFANSTPFKTACFALFDLCLHPEYIEPLRQEIENTTWGTFEKASGQLFPLMDSFMKESARLTPVESGMSFELFLCIPFDVYIHN